MSNACQMQVEFEAKIFVPKSGFDWRLNSSRLYYGGFIFFIILLILAQIFNFDQTTIQVIAFACLLTIIISSRWGYHEKQRKYGKLEGELRINDDFVNVNGTEYDWKSISDFSFNILQVLDEQLWRDDYPITRYYGGPAFSQGVDNYIDFQFLGEHFRVHFQLESTSQKIDLSNIIRRHYFLNHIELQRTYNGLHLDYEQIQELKKQKQGFTKESS